MSILVTGGTGYIGRHLMPKLDNVYTFTRGVIDLADKSAVGRLCDRYSNVDLVVHLAGNKDIKLQAGWLGPIPGDEDIYSLYRDNVLATANVVAFCFEVGAKLIFASSHTVDHGLEFYAKSKGAAEQIIFSAIRQGLLAVVLKLPGVYGGDRGDGVLYQMCKDALTQRKITIELPYSLPYDAMHIDDVVASIMAVIKNSHWFFPPSAYKVSTGEPCSLEILAKSISELVGGCEIVVNYPQEIVKRDIFSMGMLFRWRPRPQIEGLRMLLEQVRQDLGLKTHEDIAGVEV